MLLPREMSELIISNAHRQLESSVDIFTVSIFVAGQCRDRAIVDVFFAKHSLLSLIDAN